MHSLFTTAALLAPLVAAQIQGHCDPADAVQPNPIGKMNKYKNYKTTGTVNGTVAILPIKLTAARGIIPAQYPILEEQYRAWLPSLAADEYPALLQMEQNHDLYHNGVAAGPSADFNRASISFPFVDRLNDGYSSFLYNQAVIISSAATDTIAQFQTYGGIVAPGFTASCNAYEYENGTANLALPPAQRGIDQAAWANTNTDLSNPSIAYRFDPTASSPYSTDFWRNVTNQPLFSSASNGKCDAVTRLPATKVSKGAFAGVHLEGEVAILKAFYPVKGKTVWSDVFGYKVDQAYFEKPQAKCATLKGFSVVEAPA
ncbi:uncharacterized protein LTR77_009273 [Saxophila tyrrhenica]|uniref:Uncharacterized protein n=1 Tax=Saxophila tyrrhenica TaxID=1690608 RepID=A0AAV9NZ79_9PEZI|nr:hypothetical protein LTR77_009273 [Saxophila tyrrhenica]